jgi:hypothetical protein
MLYPKIRIALIVIGILWLGVFSGLSVRGMQKTKHEIQQDRDEINRLRDRFDDWGNKHTQLVVGIEGRLVRLETSLASLEKLLWGIGGAIGVQLVQSVMSLIATHRKKS